SALMWSMDATTAGSVGPDPGGRQFGRQPEQVLLCAIVKVPLQLPALGKAGLHDAGPGGLRFRQLSLEIGLQPRVLQRHPAGAQGTVEQRAVTHSGAVGE